MPSTACPNSLFPGTGNPGEQGAGLALAGSILGWAAVILGNLLIVVGLAASIGIHSSMH